MGRVYVVLVTGKENFGIAWPNKYKATESISSHSLFVTQTMKPSPQASYLTSTMRDLITIATIQGHSTPRKRENSTAYREKAALVSRTRQATGGAKATEHE